MNLIQLFKAIANAIRNKLGTSAPINAEDFPTQIGNISTGTDTSDANATASDIKTGKTAYVNGQKITGQFAGVDTSDANATAGDIVTNKTAYVNGQKITGNYAGIVPTGTLSITSNNTYDVTNYASAEVNVSGSTGYPPDWSQIAYSDTPAGIIDGFNYAKNIQNNWDSSITSMYNMYKENRKLRFFPLVDTSNVTTMERAFYGVNMLTSISNINTSNVQSMASMFYNCYSLYEIPNLNTSNVRYTTSMFQNCYSLVNVPILNLSSITNNGLSAMFANCQSLSTDSLNNILQMCINITNSQTSANRTLYNLGFRSTNYPAATIQALSKYQDFINAGWTIGY